MKKPFIAVSIVLAAAIGMLAYSNVTRPNRESGTPTSRTGEAGGAQSRQHTASDDMSVDTQSVVQQSAAAEAVTEQNVDRWVDAARHPDPATRSAAIIALARAPKERALPPLSEVLEVGDEPHRQLALRSLYTIATEQGDHDGRVRETLRSAIYHGDDDSVIQSAQGYLEDLETAQ